MHVWRSCAGGKLYCRRQIALFTLETVALFGANVALEMLPIAPSLCSHSRLRPSFGFEKDERERFRFFGFASDLFLNIFHRDATLPIKRSCPSVQGNYSTLTGLTRYILSIEKQLLEIEFSYPPAVSDITTLSCMIIPMPANPR